MQAHFTLNLLDAVVQTADVTQLPVFCMRLKFALAQIITTDQQQYFRQSYSNYFAHIDLFQCLSEKELVLNFQFQQPSLVVLLMLQGQAVLNSPAQGLVMKYPENSCTVQHLTAGHYHWTLQSGEHKMLVLTLNTDWFIHTHNQQTHYQALIQHFQNPVNPVFSLPRCALTASMMRPLKKLIAHPGRNHLDLEKTIHRFLNETVYHYHQQLVSGRLMTAEMHDIKAREIAAYVKAHYAENIVEDVPGLAAHFNVSERLFFNLCKRAFQKPLHQYVIDLRMNYALLFLTTSTRSLSEVAFAVGYSDPRYFRKAFKKYHHIAPREIQGLLM